jgi:hypothetical protein
MKVCLTLFLSLCLHLSKAQNPLTDSLESEIKKNQTNGVDTILTFMIPPPDLPIVSQISGLGEVMRLQFVYIIFKKKNKVYSKELVWYMKENDTIAYSIAISNSVILGNDSVFVFLKKSINEIENEETYPFIYQFKDSTKGLVHYEFLNEHPPSDFIIGVYTANKKFWKTVNEQSLSSSLYHGEPINLNYRGNIQTKLSVLFHMLDELTGATDSLYKFN